MIGITAEPFMGVVLFPQKNSAQRTVLETQVIQNSPKTPPPQQRDDCLGTFSRVGAFA